MPKAGPDAPDMVSEAERFLQDVFIAAEELEYSDDQLISQRNALLDRVRVFACSRERVAVLKLGTSKRSFALLPYPSGHLFLSICRR